MRAARLPSPALALALALVVSSFALGCGGEETDTGENTPPEAPDTHFLLSEVLLAPGKGQTAYLELLNPKDKEARAVGLILYNGAGQEREIPKGAVVPGGGFLILALDGKSGVDGDGAHLGAADFWDAASDAI